MSLTHGQIAEHVPPREHILPLCFFLLLTALLALRLYDALPTHYDNFSHWLLVVKDILKNNKLPGYHSELIMFQGYPTGSAGFIYYVCRIIGDSEGAMLIGQAIILTSCLTVFWAYAKKPLLCGCPILLSSVYILAANTAITDLLVDTLLSCLAIAAFAVVWYYADDPKKAGICNALIGGFLIIVKNSGVFFVVIHALVPFFFSLCRSPKQLRQSFSRKNLVFFAVSVSLPLILWCLWQFHVETSFVYGSTSYHAMTPKNYYYVILKKDPADILSMLSAFGQRVLTPGRETAPLCFILVLYGYTHIVSRKRSLGGIAAPLAVLLWSLLVYLLYLIGLMGMYIFSMSATEALALAGFDRYLSTLTVYLVGIAVLLLLHTGFPDAYALCAAALCFLLVTVRNSIPILFAEPDQSDTLRTQLLDIKETYGIPEGARCYFYTDRDVGYLYFMAQCDFWSSCVGTTESFPLSDFQSIIDDHDYFVVISQTEELETVLSDYGLPAGQIVYDLTQYR